MSDTAALNQLSPYRIIPNAMPPPAAPFVDESETHLRDYWRVVVKHRWVIALFSLIVVATTAFITFTTEKTYTAETTLQIEKQAPHVIKIEEVVQPDVFGLEKYDYYQTQFRILESRTLAASVIRDLGLENDPRFLAGSQPGMVRRALATLRGLVGGNQTVDPDTAELGVDPRLIDLYLELLEIEPVKNSRLVRVRYSTHDPQLSAQIANAHAAAYIQQGMEHHYHATGEAQQFLETKLTELKQKVEQSEAALNRYRKEHQIISLDNKENIVVGRLDDLNKRLTMAQAERIQFESQYKLIEQRQYEALPAVIDSALVQRLKQSVAELEQKYALMSEKFKPAYPSMIQIKSEVEAARARLAAEIAKVVGGIESAYLAAKTREDELRAQLDAQKDVALDLKENSVDYNMLKRDVDTSHALYESTLARMKETTVADSLRVSNVTVVDKAEAPLYASRPKRALNLLLSVIASLVMGTGLAFFFEYLDNTLKTPEEVERFVRVPALGLVPSFAHNVGSKASGAGDVPALASSALPRELVTLHHSRSVISEAYRTIRTAILLSSADNAPRVMLITSGQAGEGKTLTAVNTAITLAQSGARVLIVDADMRRPRCHRVLGAENGHGLSTLLTGQGDLRETVRPTQIENLFFISSGPIPPNPAELVGSTRMRETLALLREGFDYVLIDSPPVLPVTDGVLLATMVDGVVLVVKGQHTPKDVVRRARERLEYARAKVLGVVLNDVNVNSGDYYHSRYTYSYYGAQDAEPSSGVARMTESA
ncbi:MAG TPA: polysaccharide biosynthesis tyrosine autokinase [Candidatus Binatia bacterium]|nr:polysaccharide biosynthesis tyrosine autokinase [Candidatus Binatia bacterium]